MKICIVTGGTGGHIFPALTYADYVRKNHGDEIVFIGNDHKMESDIIPAAGYAFFPIHNQGLQGSRIDKFKAVLSQFKAIEDARKHLRKLRPDVVVSFGGYVSLPVVLAASTLKIPVVLHEQNAFPGKANRMAAKYAKAIITCYPEAFKDHKNVYYLGNPRASLIHQDNVETGIMESMHLRKDLPLVLMLMGSQGSTSMNERFLEYLAGFDHENMQVVIVPGPRFADDFKERAKNTHPNVHIHGFVNTQALMPHVTLMVARSGASTVAEIQAFGIPAILVPSPYVANNHQYYNAKSLYDQGACEILEEKNITGAVLEQHINNLLADQDALQSLSKNARKLAKTDAVSDIADLVENVVKKYEKSHA